MNATNLLLSMFFSTVGVGFIMYARKASLILPACAGLALAILPYFFSNVLVLLLVCIPLTALPFFVRDI